MRRNPLLFALLATLVALPACSAVLDIDSLQEETGDGPSPYDNAVGHLFEAPKQQRQALTAKEGVLAFRWRAQPGQPAPVDLTLSDDSARPLAQVFARKGKPFVRLGLHVVPIVAKERYQLRYSRDAKQLRMELRGAQGQLLRRVEVAAGVAPTLSLSLDTSARRVDLLASVEADQGGFEFTARR